MKRIFIALFCVCLLLTACGDNQKKSYVRDTSPGTIKEINYAKLTSMLKKDKTFVAIITQATCEHCIKLKQKITKYLKKHHVTVYDVDVVQENDPQAIWKKIQNKFDDFEGTPATIIIVKGDEADLASGELTMKKFDQLIKDYQLDAK